MMDSVFVYLFCLFFVTNYFVFLSVSTYPIDSRPCPLNQFPCEDGECIDQDTWCDDDEDCLDGSDEIYCDPSNSSDFKCPPHLFQCDIGTCIPKIGQCDGNSVCEDGSDEKHCAGTISLNLNGTNDIVASNQEIQAIESTGLRGSVESTENEEFKKIKGQSIPDEEYSGFTELNTEYYYHQREMALNYLINQRRDDYGWGSETPRALIALLLSSTSTYENSDIKLLMAKQLDVKLSIALARNQTKPIELTELALYINAILATCRNPGNFYGYDLVNTLRYRVDFEQNEKPRGNFVSPLVYLTLCINNATTERDVRKLKDLSSSRAVHTDRIGIQALALLATSCLLKHPKYSDHELRHTFIQKLLQTIKTEGLPKNIYEISLLIQALNEARVNEQIWNRAEAINILLKRQNSQSGSFGDILATYCVLPIISGRSMLSLEQHCNHFNDSDVYIDKRSDCRKLKEITYTSAIYLMPIEVLQNSKRTKIDVKYSLYHGNPIDLMLTLQIQVAEGTNFLDIMRLAQERSPNYRFKLDDRRRQPLVYSIGGVPNDAERGMFWILHFISKRTRSVPYLERLIPYYENIKTLIPKEGDEMVFWMKPL